MGVGGGTSSGDGRRYGTFGESLAARWYEAHGYVVLDRNWRTRTGEIDLVCARQRTLVVCEVKARRSYRHGAPEEAVTGAKIRRLRRLAAEWLAAHGRRLARGPRRRRRRDR